MLVAVWPHSRNLIALVSGRLGFVFFSTSVVAVVVHRVFVLNTLTLFIHLCPNRLRLSQSFFPPALFLPHFTACKNYGFQNYSSRQIPSRPSALVSAQFERVCEYTARLNCFMHVFVS